MALTPHTERIDFLIDYLDQTLFTKHETYADLLAKGARPYLILNAADMVEGIPFSFTQTNFDLLCSDLTKLRAQADEERAFHPDRAQNLERAADNSKLIEIDFDAIADPRCRAYFHNIGTSWTNSNAEIDALLIVGKALLQASPDFLSAVRELHGQVHGTLPSVDQVCQTVRG